MPDLLCIIKLIDLLVEVGAGEPRFRTRAQVVIFRMLRVFEVAVVGRLVMMTTFNTFATDTNEVTMLRFRAFLLLIDDQRLLDLRVNCDHGLVRSRVSLGIILLFVIVFLSIGC